MVSVTKDPAKVRAGQASARVRWGDAPRVVRLDDLNPPQRRLVMALIDAARREAERETPALQTRSQADPSTP